MNPMFAVVLAPPTTNQTELANWMVQQERQQARANVAYVNGQMMEMQHRIDRLENGLILFAVCLLIFGFASWHWHRTRPEPPRVETTADDTTRRSS